MAPKARVKRSVAKAVSTVSSHIQDGKDQRCQERVIAYMEEKNGMAQMLCDICDSGLVDMLWAQATGHYAEAQPLASCVNQMGTQPVWMQKKILATLGGEWWANPSHLKLLKSRDPKALKHAVLFATAYPPTFPVAAGTLPSELLEMCKTRAEHTGNRLRPIRVHDHGRIPWSTCGPYNLEQRKLGDKQWQIKIKARFHDCEVIR